MSSIRLTCHGAARTVTGSRHLLELPDRKLLIDGGMFQGLKELRLRNWSSPGFDAREIDEVLLTHAHIDHSGYLPRLTKLGLDAPILCTPATADLLEVLLMDAAKLQEEDADFANRKGYSKHHPAEPLFDANDAAAALALRQAVEYYQPVQLGSAAVTWHNAGHLLGSAFLEVAIDGDHPLRVVFSGDIGRYGSPLHPDPEPRPECDVLVMESTYGDRTHDPTPLEDQLAGPVGRCLARKGIVLIPAFAVGRSQQITLVLRRLMRDRLLPRVPIHLDSPMAVDATSIYSRYLDPHNLDRDVFEDGRIELFPKDVHFHRHTSASKSLNSLRGPRIIISSSGMLTGGRILHHLARLAPDPNNLVLLAGYQAPGTRGRSLVEGAPSVKIHGQTVPIRCEVESITGLSGHADRNELLRWLESAPLPKRLILVHGEEKAMRSLATEIHERHGLEAELPVIGQTMTLRP